jgi:hypothetical protein
MRTLLSSFKNSLVCIEILSKLIRFLPYVMPASQDGEGSVDLSTLRTFRVLRPLKLVSGVPSKLSFAPPLSFPRETGLQAPQDRLRSAKKAFFPPSLIPPPGNRSSGSSRSSQECKESFLSPLPHPSPGQSVFRPLKIVSGVQRKLSFPPTSSLHRETGPQSPEARLRSAK